MNILGLKTFTAKIIVKERDSQMDSKHFDPIENFPDKIDQLMASLNRVC